MSIQSLKENKIIGTIWRIFDGSLLLLFLAVPFYGKYFHTEQESWPDWLNAFFMDFHTLSWKILFVTYALMAAYLYYGYYNSYDMQKHFSNRGLLLSDLELGKKQVLLKLAEKGELGRATITVSGHMAQEEVSCAEQSTQEEVSGAEQSTQEEVSGGSGIGDQEQNDPAVYAWIAKQKGLTIRSAEGEDTGYLLLNCQEYEGRLLPFYIGGMTSKSNVFWFLKEQDFELVWQHEKRACYKKGDWKLLLAFHGIWSRVQVLELMKGEQTSLLEQTVLEAQKLSFEDQMAAAFQEFRVALKALWEEKKKRKTTQNEE